MLLSFHNHRSLRTWVIVMEKPGIAAEYCEKGESAGFPVCIGLRNKVLCLYWVIFPGETSLLPCQWHMKSLQKSQQADWTT